jgi:nitrate reductase gamma subunit
MTRRERVRIGMLIGRPKNATHAMSSIAGTVAVVAVLLAATSVALLWLLMRRTRTARVLRESEGRFRVIASIAPV